MILKYEDVRRNQWLVAIVIDAFPDNDGVVRSVKVQTGSRNDKVGAVMDRPIVKLVLLLKVE